MSNGSVQLLAMDNPRHSLLARHKAIDLRLLSLCMTWIDI